MRGLIFLVVNLAIISSFSVKSNEVLIVDLGHDDIPEPPNIQRSAVNTESSLWPDTVPYVLDKSLEMNAKGIILRAFEQFGLKSCIAFKPRDSETYYISFLNIGGCLSFVGRVIPNGQPLSIGRFCDNIAAVEQLLFHAFGFNYEHVRYDRDNFVTIVFENIRQGFERHFAKVSSESSTTNGLPYDYFSLMHFGKNAFSNGNGSTIITKYPKFQDVIGQRNEMSPRDALELNRLYKCNSTIAFKMHCSFSNGGMCQMSRCSQNGTGWQMVTIVSGGPNSDHSNQPGGSGDHSGQGAGYFMHASTASGKEGDSAWLETKRMSPTRKCHNQCLQFYYYHTGNEADQLNIWIREFQDEQDVKGTLRLMGQITGSPKSYWQLHHVSLNATKHFQVVFESRKGAGSSSGGFSIDDINLSETECPHLTMQINNFGNLFNTSGNARIIYSSRQYSRGGYAYRIGIVLDKSFFGLFVQLLSGKYDDQLEWPCVNRQVTFQMVDQNPNIQQQMSKQRSITTDLRQFNNGSYIWDNPRKVGNSSVENNETIFAGPLFGIQQFASLEDLNFREYLKGESAAFVFSFQDITPLVNGSALPCPEVGPVEVKHPPRNMDEGPCATRIFTTTKPPPKTTDDDRILTTKPPPKTTDDDRILTPKPPPKTTDDDSIFGVSPGLVASPVLTLLVALMLVIHR